MLAEFVGHRIFAFNHTTSEHWGREAADRHTWIRAQQLISDMADNGSGPVAQHMEPLVHFLMATFVPTYGASRCSGIINDPVFSALPNRGSHADTTLPQSITEMLAFLNCQEGHLFYMAFFDTVMAQYGS